MKRITAFLLTCFLMLPISAHGEFVEAEGTFHFPWGIEETDTLIAAVKKTEAGTGWEFSQFLSPDGAYLHGYSSLPEGKTLLGAPTRYVEITPKSDDTLPDDAPIGAIRSNDEQALWSGIRISFDENIDFPASLAEVYQSLCESYGEPDSQTFSVTETTLDGVQYVAKEFPIAGGVVSDEFSKVINGSNDFLVKAYWYNVTLQFARFYGKSAFTLHFSSSKPMVRVEN